MKLGLIMAVSGVALQAVSSEWYVSSSAATGGDGSREAPFQTIQAAVDAAAEDDIVKVMPGVYDTGSTNDGYMASRVWLTKRLTLEATGTKDETHIVGVRSTASGGYGSDAVRCIYAGQTPSATAACSAQTILRRDPAAACAAMPESSPACGSSTAPSPTALPYAAALCVRRRCSVRS